MRDERWEKLLETVTEVAAGRDLEDLIDILVQRSCELTGARYGALGIIDQRGGERRLSRFATFGIDDETREAIGDYPVGRGLLGHLIDHPEPLRLDDLTRHPAAVGMPPHHPRMTTFLGVPVHVGEAVYGNLYLADKPGGFDAFDERLTVALAAAAGVAIVDAQLYAALIDAREEHASLAVYADRDRIARDLHDIVIQRLFATGLSLHRAARRADDDTAETLIEAVEEIDTIIAEVRRTIFELGDRTDLAGALQRVLDDAEDALGTAPTIRIQGDPDRLDPALVQHVIAVVREGLANVTRHAEAEHAEVSVVIGDEELRVEVIDDGVGLDPRVRRASGLRNLRQRAQARGGSSAAAALAAGGTRLVWSVPLPIGSS